MKKKNNIKLYLLFLFITYVFIFSDVGIIAKIKLTQKMQDLENQMLNLENENKILQATIEKLKYDKNYIAEKARDLGYAQKTEKIYRFYEEKPVSNTNIQQTNKHSQFFKHFNIKDYFAYLIVFFIVIIIYILLIFYHRNNNHKN